MRLFSRFAGAAALVVVLLGSGGAAAAGSGDWTQYLADLDHTGFAASETVITPASAPGLQVAWSLSAPGPVFSEPTVANGRVFWTSWDGFEHAATVDGTPLWDTPTGTSKPECDDSTYGPSSTAAVATVGGVETVFVGGGDARFYALNAATGAVRWVTRLGPSPESFVFASPVLFGGSVYIGLSSVADCPLVQGKVFKLDAATGAIQATFSTVPDGCVGAGVWGSTTLDASTGLIYFATGNHGLCDVPEPLSEAVVAVRASDLSLVSAWRVPDEAQVVDSDFGGTPTLFQATINGSLRKLVGVVNKNGRYYAFDRADIAGGPVWQQQIAAGGPSGFDGSLVPSAWDGSRLYVAGGLTTINGGSCTGSVRALDPATGAPIWERCLSGPVIGPVTAAPGIVEVAGGKEIVVVKATDGTPLFTYLDSALFFSGGAIANGVLYHGTTSGKLLAFSTTAKAPVNVAAPTASGSAVQGQVLSATTGTWTGTQPIAYAYQWQSATTSGGPYTNIVGATAATYTLGSADVGRFVRVAVTASNSAGSATAFSNAIGPVVAGTTLTFSVSASGDDGHMEKGDSGYPPSSGTADGSTTWPAVLVRRSNTQSGYQPVSVGLVRFETSTIPDNATVVAARLRVYATDVDSTDGRNVVAEWYSNWPIDPADWTNTDAATAHAGTPLASLTTGQQVDFQLQNLTSVNRTGMTGLRLHIGGAASAPSGPNDFAFASFDDPVLPAPELIVSYTTPAGAAPVNTAAPVASGGAVVGQTLSTTTGTWTNSPSSFAYQWQSSTSSGGPFSNIAGATSATYKLAAGDAGRFVRALVTASNGFGSASAASNVVGPVTNPTGTPPVNTSLPTIVGKPVVGRTLTAATGTWTGTTPMSFAFQWRRCDAAGASCVAIASATASTYVAQAADLGSTIRVAVTASNTAGQSTATSVQTNVVRTGA